MLSLALITLVLAWVAQALAVNVRHYELNITLNDINPDCSDFRGARSLLVNQQLPGPAITVTEGEWLRIVVRNQLPASNLSTDDTSIHFHGIRQYGSTESDGVPMLTQMPIPPGGEFTYTFHIVNQAGTYFYHAHVGLQEGTVFGPLIIYESPQAKPNTSEIFSHKLVAGPYAYDDERTVLLSEWWHRERIDLEDYLLGPQFTLIPDAESILLNGRTIYDPTTEVAPNCPGYTIVPVQPNAVYRIRVIGATAFRTLGFAIAHHNMTVIEVDGDLVKPFEVSYLEVAPGQRFSVLIHTNRPPRDYAIGTIRRWAEDASTSSNGMAILRYTDDPAAVDPQPMLYTPSDLPRFPSDEKPHWIWSQLEPVYGVDPIARRPAHRTIKLRSTEARMPDGSLRHFVNDIAFEDPDTPYLARVLKDGPAGEVGITGYAPHLGTYTLEYYKIVDFVLQSTHIPGTPCRSHPWHTHGHSHWEIAYGRGEYVEERDGHLRNVPTPLNKDITMVYPYIDPSLETVNGTLVTHAVGCGWSKIRILTDNPGIWAMHCHNTPHMIMGMMVALEEAPERIQPRTYDFISP